MEEVLAAAVVLAAAAAVDDDDDGVAVVLGVMTTTEEDEVDVGVAATTDVISVLVGWTMVDEGSDRDRDRDRGRMEMVAATLGIERLAETCLWLCLLQGLDSTPVAIRRAARAGRVEYCMVTD